MDKNRRLTAQRFPLHLALLLGALGLSIFVSLAFFEQNKTVFRLLKIALFMNFAALVGLRLLRTGFLKTELIFFIYPVSALFAALYNFGFGVHTLYTIDGPVFFCIAVSGMISFIILSGRSSVLVIRSYLPLLFILGSSLMSITSYGGFLLKLIKGGFGSTIDAVAAAVIQQDNWNGILNNPNAIATFFLMGIVANGLFFLINRDRLSRGKLLLLHTLTVVFFVNALLTQCRGVVLSSVVFALALIVWYYRSEIRGGKITRKRILFVCAVILSSLTAIVLLELRFGIMSTLLAKTLLSKSSFRLEFWTGFLSFNADHFSIKTIVGYGYQPSTHHYNTVNPYYGMHNFFFEIWARYGLAAVICMLAAIGRAVYVYAKRSGVDGYVVSLLPVLMHNLFEDYVFFHIHLLTSLFFIYLLAVIISSNARAYGDYAES